jgi:hypothetical protein
MEIEKTKFVEIAGEWMLSRSGPDGINLGSLQDAENPDGLHGTNINDDPTNGTMSRGNIFRTQKDPEKMHDLPE